MVGISVGRGGQNLYESESQDCRSWLLLINLWCSFFDGRKEFPLEDAHLNK